MQPIEDCLPEHFPKLAIAGGFNNREAEIKVLFRREDAKIGARPSLPRVCKRFSAVIKVVA